MKKMTSLFLALLVVVLLCGGALAVSEPTIEEMIAANSSAALSESFESFEVVFTYPEGTSLYVYIDQDTYLCIDELYGKTTLYSPQELCELIFYEDGEYFDRIINPWNEDFLAEMKQTALRLVLPAAGTVEYTLQEDDVLYVEVKATAEQWSEEDTAMLGFELGEGECYVCELDIDPQTGCFTRCEDYILYEDGTRSDLSCAFVAVNVEKPEIVAELEARGKAIDELPAEEACRLTCVVDPGLESEYAVTRVVEEDSFVLFPYNMQGYEIYLDAEGTQPMVLPDDVEEFVGFCLNKDGAYPFAVPDQEGSGNYTIYMIKK